MSNFVIFENRAAAVTYDLNQTPTKHPTEYKWYVLKNEQDPNLYGNCIILESLSEDWNY